MKIEEAIVYCLATSNRGMRTEQIADIINRQRLHLHRWRCTPGPSGLWSQQASCIVCVCSCLSYEEHILRPWRLRDIWICSVLRFRDDPWAQGWCSRHCCLEAASACAAFKTPALIYLYIVVKWTSRYWPARRGLIISGYLFSSSSWSCCAALPLHISMHSWRCMLSLHKSQSRIL